MAGEPIRRGACPGCGGELRYSHREYRGKGQSIGVRRCAACGATVRSEVALRPSGGGSRRARPPVDEGPPRNTVLDPDTAARILREKD